MPPKQRGHNARGRQKIFRHAVENVSIGIGHTAIGSISLQLAAGVSSSIENADKEQCAFHVELNHQLLSHSSKDFTRFRWEVLEWCETKSILLLHHREVAEALIERLLDRSSGTFSGHSSTAKVQGETVKGTTLEAYEAYLRLTIAFARDLKAKFLPYFEVFQQAVHAGLYDKKGSVIASADRLQYLYSVQAAWCREMLEYWEDPQYHRLTQRIIRLYVQHFLDSKEYIRRLSAELLSFLCRLCRKLTPLVVQEACGEVVKDYAHYVAGAIEADKKEGEEAAGDRKVGDDDEEEEEDLDEDHRNNRGDEMDKKGEEVGEKEADGNMNPLTPYSTALSLSHIHAYIEKDYLPFHPIVNALTFFVVHLFRGIQGTLSSSMEFFYLELLQHFYLLSQMQEVKHGSDSPSIMSSVVGNASAAVESCSLPEGQNRVQLYSIKEELITGFPPSLVPIASDHILVLWREIGSLVIKQALVEVLIETRKQSLKDIGKENSDDSGNDSVEEEGGMEHSFPSTLGVMHAPSHRLLSVVVQHFQPNVYHLHLLDGLLKASNYFLWRDKREDALFRTIAQQLRTEVKSCFIRLKESINEESTTTSLIRDSLSFWAAVLELLIPLCVSPYVTGEMDFGKRHMEKKMDRPVQLQQLFLKVGKEAIGCISYFAFGPWSPSILPPSSFFGNSSTPFTKMSATSSSVEASVWRARFLHAEAAQTLLLSFAQDVLSKNFCFCLSEERRLNDDNACSPSEVREWSDAADTVSINEGNQNSPTQGFKPSVKSNVPSFLTPLALTLLRSIGMEWWGASVRLLASDSEEESKSSASCAPSSQFSEAREIQSSKADGHAPFWFSTSLKNICCLSTTTVHTQNVEWWTACRHLLERGILLLRIVSDTTKHSSCTPLQQILRLQPIASGASPDSKSTASASSKHNSPQEDPNTSMPCLLKLLFFRLASWFLAVQKTVGDVGENYKNSSLFSEAYSSPSLVYCMQFIREVCQSASEIFVCMLPLSDVLFSASVRQVMNDESGGDTSRWASLLLQIQSNTVLDSVGNIGYLIHAHVSLHVLRILTYFTKTSDALGYSVPSSSSATKPNSPTKDGKVAMHHRFSMGNQEWCIEQHLSQLIHLLFCGLEQTTLPKPSQEKVMSVGSSKEEEYAALPSSEGERMQLYRAAEMMLEALRIGLFADSGAKGRKHVKFSSSRGAQEANFVLLLPLPLLRSAVRLLKTHLSPEVQRKLSYILLDCLASPIQSLRVAALQLLQVLCDPSLAADEGYVEGLSCVDQFIFVALLGAECYNPLSHSGNMDGIRRALNPVVSAVEMRTLVDPFSKIIIGRAMIGLYYLKFSEAWSIAQGVLVELSRSESRRHSSESVSTEGGTVKDFTSSPLGTVGQDSIWTEVVNRYGRILTLGDAATSVCGARMLCDGSTRRGKVEEEEVETQNGVKSNISETMKMDQYVIKALSSYRLYKITLTDQQQHEKGEMISRSFSSVLYNASRYSVIDLPSSDGEVLSWELQWRQMHLNPYSSLPSSKAGNSARGPSITDPATVSKTFLKTLIGIAKYITKPTDHRLSLLESLLLELSSVYHKEHPSGLTVVLKQIEERVELALQACTNGPSLSIPDSERQQLAVAHDRQLSQRAEQLITLSLSFLAEENGRLQRAAIDSLKHLKVEPFSRYHAKLIPFADNMKYLFHFLSSFHIVDEIPPTDRESYISTVLLVVLPKLISKVSKEKKRDQAVLQRRIFSFLQDLPPDEEGNRSADALYPVIVGLLQRLLFSKTQKLVGDFLPLHQLNFMHTWEEMIMKEEEGTTTDRQCNRFIHHLLKRLLSSLRLLESLMSSVGIEFASCVPLTLTLALQAYLVACKQNLSSIVDTEIKKVEFIEHEEGIISGGEGSSAPLRRLQALIRLRQALQGRMFATIASHVRRSSIQLVATLMEQFPLEVMNVIGKDFVGATNVYEDTLFGKYMKLLYHNSKGATRNKDQNSEGWGGSSKVGGKVGVHTTPILRLVRAWLMGPSLIPLISFFGKEVSGTFQEVFAVRDTHYTSEYSSSRFLSVSMAGKASVKDMHEALSCITDILRLSDEEIQLGESERQEKGKKKKKDCIPTLRSEFIIPHLPTIFESLYRLLLKGAEDEQGSVFSSSSFSSASGNKTMMRLPLPLWRELLHTITALTSLSREGLTQAEKNTPSLPMTTMEGKILEIAIRFASSPVCNEDSASLMVALEEIGRLVESVKEISLEKHYYPLARLFNALPFPAARISLSQTFQILAEKISFHCLHQASFSLASAQLKAVARAVKCLNSFEEENTVLDRYDFDLRFHTFNSLQQFFSHDGNYKALSRGEHPPKKCLANQFLPSSRVVQVEEREKEEEEEGGHLHKQAPENISLYESKHPPKTRHERDYSGPRDCTIPLERKSAQRKEEKGTNNSNNDVSASPLRVLVVEGIAVLAANVMFFLRDSEGTIRTFARHLLDAMIGYVSRVKDNDTFKENVVEKVIRRIILPSLRRGVVARDVMIRGDHMSSFGALGRYFSTRFPSFSSLYSPNSEANFFSNVNHVNPKSRLNALGLLRRRAQDIHVRDLLRVFIPFLLSAVKDFAQGKRELQNLTEGKAKGYCDAVLMTIAFICEKLPWMAYHRVLILLLQNAKSNPDLRLPMLRGVVQVLEHFHFLDEGKQLQKADVVVERNEDLEVSDGDDEKVKEKAQRIRKEAEKQDAKESNEEVGDKGTSAVEWYDEGKEVINESFSMAQDRTHHYHKRIIQALEKDILPPLFEFIYDAKTRRGLGVGQDSLGTQAHTISSIRKEEEIKNQSLVKNTLIQLPVALAVTKIVKKLPEERYHEYLNILLDDVISKLRTKKDKQRQSARRILGVMLQETGPQKLQYVIRKLKAHLVHGYQLHVLGYTVVTVLYQLYEPHNILLRSEEETRQVKMLALKSFSPSKSPSSSGRKVKDEEESRDVITEALQLIEQPETSEEEGKTKRVKLEANNSSTDGARGASLTKERKVGGMEQGGNHKAQVETQEEEESMIISMAEEALIRQLVPISMRFDLSFGVECLTEIMDELMVIFLDDYLGEIGHQKEQIELMSKMEEVKRNRSLQGFVLLAKHAKAEKVITAFIQHMKWVLTPSSAQESQLNASSGGSAYVRTIIKAEIEKKYTTVGKVGYTADISFVKKVRELSLSVAKNFLLNPTLEVHHVLCTVDSLLQRHNDIREERIRAFESKDGTRRIRGNAHMLIHSAPKHSLKEQLDGNFLLAPEPERVDVDFVAHTVLATQQKNKLKVYKGRYAKEIQRASKDFYREDSTTAVVLDTLDEFLLRLLLSMLRKVLGIGHDKGRNSVIELDLLRRYRDKMNDSSGTITAGNAEKNEGIRENSDVGNANVTNGSQGNDEHSEEEEDTLDPSALHEGTEDALDTFAAAAIEESEDNIRDLSLLQKEDARKLATHSHSVASNNGAISLFQNLSVAFTVEHRDLLQSLLTVVLTTLEGEGSDAVISHALDSVLALVSLRPPLELQGEATQLLQLIVMYFERGGPIKQRALRLCAGIISHQLFSLSLEEAKRMVLLIRAEVLDRTEFLPMALSLLYAILGKHLELEEIYDLVDLLTELLVHLSGNHVICTRIKLCLVRFLTEYKLTMPKFRSHVDLICRNLDYPELSGRLALLDLLNALLIRLPTVVVRQEAPVILLPLAVMASQGVFPQDRERAGEVLQTLVKLAGVDVVAPIIEGWVETSKDHSMRIMGMQTITLCMKIIRDVFSATGSVDQEGDGDNTGAEFQQSVEWCIPLLMDVCRAAPLPGDSEGKTSSRKGKGKGQGDKTKKKKKRGWSLIFYALRSFECITHTAPQRMFPLIAGELIPLLLEKLILYPHNWVRGVCFRLLNEYCYSFVEKRSHYLQASFPIAPDALHEDKHEVLASSSEVLPLIFPPGYPSSQSDSTCKDNALPTSSITPIQNLIRDLSVGIKRIFTLVGESDLGNEKHQANAEIDHPARSQLIKLAIYFLRAFQQSSLALLVMEKMHSSAKSQIHKHYGNLHRHIKAIAAPILKQGSAVNYVLRCATLSQILGGYIGILPHDRSEHTEAENECDPLRKSKELYVKACQYLLSPQGSSILLFVTHVIAPLLKTAVGARKLSHRLAEVGFQSLKVLQDQLQTRSWYWETAQATSSAADISLCGGHTRKRIREVVAGNEAENGSVRFMDALTALRMIESSSRELTQVKRIRKDVQKSLKRNRSEISRR